MTRRPWSVAVLALLVMTTVAGCLGDEETDPPAGADSDDGAMDHGDNDDAAPRGDAGGDKGDSGSGNTGGDAANGPPTAAFTVTANETILVGDSIDFDASASVDPEGGELSFSWDFGDGTTAEGVTVNHTYADAGNFTVNLTVTDADGASDIANETLTIVAAGVETGIIATFSGAITLMNPVIAGLGIPDQTKTLAMHRQLGGVENTHFRVFTFEGAPTDVPVLRFKATASDPTTQLLAMRIFPEDGSNYIRSSSFPTGRADLTLTPEQQTETTYHVFLWLNAGANSTVTLEISVEDAPAT